MSAELLSIMQAAEILGVSRTRLIQWDQRKQLVPASRGRRGVRLYKIEDVLAFRQQRFEAQVSSVTRGDVQGATAQAARDELLGVCVAILQKAKASDDPAKWLAAAPYARVLEQATTSVTVETRTMRATTASVPWMVNDEAPAPA